MLNRFIRVCLTHIPQQAVGLFSVAMLFAVMGILTSLNDIMIPHLKEVFSLTYREALIIQLVWFTAFLVFSYPASILVKRTSYKKGMIIGYLLTGTGCFLYYPIALVCSYIAFLTALFVIAIGVSLLQTISNPYGASLGKPETAHNRLVILHGFHALGMTLAPWLLGPMILSYPPIGETMQLEVSQRYELAKTVISPYLALTVILLFITYLTWQQKLPNPLINEAGLTNHDSAWHYRHTLFGALAAFAYVGTEVLLGSFMINFIKSLGLKMSSAQMAHFISYYWFGIMVGRFAGPWIMTRVSARQFLALSSLLSLVLVLGGIYCNGWLALWAVTLVGLCNSIMFPLIYSLALNKLSPNTAIQASGIISTAIIGGGLIPMLAALIADFEGIQQAFWVSFCCYAIILSFSLFGCKPVKIRKKK